MLKLVLVLTMLATPAFAEEPTPAWPASDRKAADWLSAVSVATSIGLDTLHSVRSADRAHALKEQALRTGVTIGISEVVKRLVHRERPDHSDRLSFWSEHTALAAASAGWNLQVTIPLTFSAGYLRIAADKHHPSDVIVGALVGSVAARLFK